MLQFKKLPEFYFENVTDKNLSWKAYYYCAEIKDREDVRKLIADSEDAYFYCEDIKDRPEIRKSITSSEYAYLYCIYVKDRPEVRKNITESDWKQQYLEWKNNVTV